MHSELTNILKVSEKRYELVREMKDARYVHIFSHYNWSFKVQGIPHALLIVNRLQRKEEVVQTK